MRQIHRRFLFDNRHQSSVESLPNELFLQIFSYLTPEELFKAFQNLNSRIGVLIRSVFIQLRITDGNAQLLSEVKASQIKSMMVSDPSGFNMVLTYFQANQLTQLERLHLIFVGLQSIRTFFEVAPQLDNLKYLRISDRVDGAGEESEVCYQTIAELLFIQPLFTRLKYIELFVSERTPYYGHMFRTNHMSMLEYFSVFNICLDDLAIILTWMPQIKSIRIIYAFIVNDDGEGDPRQEHDLTSRALIKMPAIISLRQLNIGVCHGVACKHMQLLLNKLSELRRFNCTIWSEDLFSIEYWIRIFLLSKIDSLNLTLITSEKWIYNYLFEQLTADIWYRQMFNTAVVKSVSGGICLEANSFNVSRIEAAKEFDDRSSSEHQNKKQRIH